jgi:hypothetical protein
LTLVNWNEWQYDWDAEEKNGLILRDVFYKGRKYLAKINVPIIRVKYADDTGPFNDQIGEDGFAEFTDCDNNKICTKAYSKNGTEWLDIRVGCHIGAYSIQQAFLLYRNGTMAPRVWSRGVHSSVLHTHHAYWRMDFDIDGPANDSLWVKNGDSANSWQKVTVETAFSKAIRNRLDVFARGADNELWSKHWDGLQWGQWKKRGGFFNSAPAAVSWGDDRIDVFVWGQDNHVGHLWYNGSKWKGWQDLGHPDTGGITSSPAAASIAPNHLSILVKGADNALYNRAWNGEEWGPWWRRGGTIQDAPAAVSTYQRQHFAESETAPYDLHVFVRGMDNKIGHLWWDSNNGWQGWEGLDHPPNVPIASGPAVSSRGPGQLEVFARGNDNALWRRIFKNGAWGQWNSLGASFKDAPAAVSWGADNINVLIRGMDNKIGRMWWDNINGWQGWEGLEGTLTSGPAVSTRAFIRRCAVEDSQTKHGVKIVPGLHDGRPDDFSKADYAVRLYHDDEDEEWPFSCWSGLGYDDDESVDNTDIVVWYIAHLTHDATHEPEKSDGEWHTGGPNLHFY